MIPLAAASTIGSMAETLRLVLAPLGGLLLLLGWELHMNNAESPAKKFNIMIMMAAIIAAMAFWSPFLMESQKAIAEEIKQTQSGTNSGVDILSTLKNYKLPDKSPSFPYLWQMAQYWAVRLLQPLPSIGQNLVLWFQGFSIQCMIAVSPLLLGMLAVPQTNSVGIRFITSCIEITLWPVGFYLVDMFMNVIGAWLAPLCGLAGAASAGTAIGAANAAAAAAAVAAGTATPVAIGVLAPAVLIFFLVIVIVYNLLYLLTIPAVHALMSGASAATTMLGGAVGAAAMGGGALMGGAAIAGKGVAKGLDAAGKMAANSQVGKAIAASTTGRAIMGGGQKFAEAAKSIASMIGGGGSAIGSVAAKGVNALDSAIAGNGGNSPMNHSGSGQSGSFGGAPDPTPNAFQKGVQNLAAAYKPAAKPAPPPPPVTLADIVSGQKEQTAALTSIADLMTKGNNSGNVKPTQS